MANPYANEEGVFRNKPGFSNEKDLQAFEYRATDTREAELSDGRVKLQIEGFGLERLQAIHGHLLQDVYEWAGQVRATQSSKRANDGMVSVFERPENIRSAWKELANEANDFAQAKNLDLPAKQQRLANIYIEANRIHAFPEGNGRSLRVFINELAKEQGIAMDYTRTTAPAWNLASAQSAKRGLMFEGELYPKPSNLEPIKKIFEEIARPARALDFERHAEVIATAKHPELSAAYQGLRAVEDMLQQTPSANTLQIEKYVYQVTTELSKRLDQNKLLEQTQEKGRAATKPPPDRAR
jgi:cell filamentation protein